MPYFRILLIIHFVLTTIGAAVNRTGSLTFQVVDRFGKEVAYRMESCTDADGREFANSFLGLEASRLPFGTYTYTLIRRDVVTSYGKIKGKTAVRHPQNAVVLVADPTLEFGPEGSFAVDRAVPPDFVISEQINPMPKGPVWVRLQASFERTVAWAKVSPSGEFRIYEPLMGSFVLYVFKDGALIHLEPVVFLESVRPDPLLVRLGEPPALRTVH